MSVTVPTLERVPEPIISPEPDVSIAPDAVVAVTKGDVSVTKGDLGVTKGDVAAPIGNAVEAVLGLVGLMTVNVGAAEDRPFCTVAIGTTVDNRAWDAVGEWALLLEVTAGVALVQPLPESVCGVRTGESVCGVRTGDALGAMDGALLVDSAGAALVQPLPKSVWKVDVGDTLGVMESDSDSGSGAVELVKGKEGDAVGGKEVEPFARTTVGCTEGDAVGNSVRLLVRGRVGPLVGIRVDSVGATDGGLLGPFVGA